MADDEQPNDISKAQHFALRATDRGERGALLRLYDEMDDPKKQALLRYAAELLRKPHE